MKIFDAFKNSRQLVEETDFLKIYKCLSENVEYRIIITKKIANKFSIIHCIDDYIAWEQVPRFWRLAGRRYGDRIPIYKFDKTTNIVSIFVVRGAPNGITGLDDGIFCCANNFDISCLNVMTYRRLKEL